MSLKTLFASTTLAALATGAFADNITSVNAFYDLLSNPRSDSRLSAFVEATDEDWISVGNYSGQDKPRDAFIGQVGGFGQMIPDLNWAVQDMHQDGDFVTVRSRATGTPIAPFFGVDGQGRSFDIMTIDIHQLEDGKIVKTWHVEDWAGALQQLSGK